MLIEKLRSVLAHLEFKFQINFWEGEGVPFHSRLTNMFQKSIQLLVNCSVREKLRVMCSSLIYQFNQCTSIFHFPNNILNCQILIIPQNTYIKGL